MRWSSEGQRAPYRSLPRPTAQRALGQRKSLACAAQGPSPNPRMRAAVGSSLPPPQASSPPPRSINSLTQGKRPQVASGGMKTNLDEQLQWLRQVSPSWQRRACGGSLPSSQLSAPPCPCDSYLAAAAAATTTTETAASQSSDQVGGTQQYRTPLPPACRHPSLSCPSRGSALAAFKSATDANKVSNASRLLAQIQRFVKGPPPQPLALHVSPEREAT